jgi:hypothetical protein
MMAERVYRLRYTVVAVIGLLASGCQRHRASTAECAAIFDSIFALEFREVGFRDPVLERRKHDELAAKFAPDLQECRGSLIRAGAVECAARAQTSAELSRRCLR